MGATKIELRQIYSIYDPEEFSIFGELAGLVR